MSSLSDAWNWYRENKGKFYSGTVVVPGTSSTEFIQNAIKRPGALTAKARAAGAITKRGTINLRWARAMAKRGDLTGQQARFFLNVLRRR